VSGHTTCPLKGWKEALVKRSQFAWWEEAIVAFGFWLAALLALAARRRG
jgi:hypothetical protein